MMTVALVILAMITPGIVFVAIHKEGIFPPIPVSKPIALSEPIPAFKPTPPSGINSVRTLTTTDEMESAPSKAFQRRNFPEDEQKFWKTLTFLSLGVNSIFICLMEYSLRRGWYREDKIKEELSRLRMSLEMMERFPSMPTEQALRYPASMVFPVKMATLRKHYTVDSKALGEKEMSTPRKNYTVASKVIAEKEKATHSQIYTVASKALGEKEKVTPRKNYTVASKVIAEKEKATNRQNYTVASKARGVKETMAIPRKNYTVASKAMPEEEKMATPTENFNAVSKAICKEEKMATPMENFNAVSKAIC
jgi:hypothetical protein